MDKNNLTKTLYIPIEIFNRELAGALILSIEACKKGFTVILGGKQAVFKNMYRFSKSPGVFFLKSIVPGEVFKQEEIISYGHKIVSLDIEGLVRTPGSAGVKLRYSKKSILKTDLLFFWGEDHFNAVRDVYPEITSKSIITGAPSIDELIIRRKGLKEKAVERNKLLIATSTAFANNLIGEHHPIQMARNAYAENLNRHEISRIELNIKRDLEIFNYWKKIIPIIAITFPQVQITVRPHPFENEQFWKIFLGKYSNIKVEHGTPLINELPSTKLFLHFNSTSAIASRILGIKTLMILPPDLDEQLLSNCSFVKDISEIVTSDEDLLSKIKIALKSESFEMCDEDLYRYCENLKPNNSLASQRIIKGIDDFFVYSKEEFSMNSIDLKINLYNKLRSIKFFIMWLLGFLQRTLSKKSSTRFPPKNAYESSRRKQPKVDKKELFTILNEMYEIKMLDKLEIIELSKNVFNIKFLK